MSSSIRCVVMFVVVLHLAQHCKLSKYMHACRNHSARLRKQGSGASIALPAVFEQTLCLNA